MVNNVLHVSLIFCYNISFIMFLLLFLDENDVRWNTAATTVERIREQSKLSLTERLRREFGVDASESDEDKNHDCK